MGLADQRSLEGGAEASTRGAAGAIPALPHQDASAPPSILKHLPAHLSMYIANHSPLPLTFSDQEGITYTLIILAHRLPDHILLFQTAARAGKAREEGPLSR